MDLLCTPRCESFSSEKNLSCSKVRPSLSHGWAPTEHHHQNRHDLVAMWDSWAPPGRDVSLGVQAHNLRLSGSRLLLRRSPDLLQDGGTFSKGLTTSDCFSQFPQTLGQHVNKKRWTTFKCRVKTVIQGSREVFSCSRDRAVFYTAGKP